MNARRSIAAALSAVLLLATGWAAAQAVTYRFEPASTMRLEGTSTGKSWSCQVIKMNGELQTEAAAPDEALSAADAMTVTIPVQALKCGNRVMDSRLYRILQSEEHPDIVYTLSAVTPGAVGAWTATGTLALAGTSHTFSMDVAAVAEGDDQLRVTGEVPLKMTDFGIDPPSFAVLKTGDDMTVHFDVLLKGTPSATPAAGR